MKQDIFEKVGKRMPYNTPEGYFEASENALREVAKHKSKFTNHHTVQADRKNLPNTNSYWYYAIAASLALAVGIWSLVQFIQQPTPAPTISIVVEPVYFLSEDDAMDDWSDFADADIFLENLE